VDTLGRQRVSDPSNELSKGRADHPETEVVLPACEVVDVETLSSGVPIRRSVVVVVRQPLVVSHVESLVLGGCSR